MQEELDELPNHTLHCTNLSIVHPRRSVSSDQPFSLSVPDFHIASGEVVALVGPNGAGKSTLSRVLCGLDPLVGGSITIDGTATAGKGLQTRVGYLFQNPDYGIFLLPSGTSWDGPCARSDTWVHRSENRWSARVHDCSIWILMTIPP